MSVKQIYERVYRIPVLYEGGSTVFLYLLRGDSLALVDTGTCDAPDRVLRPALAEIGVKLSDVEVILNTHGHLDHAGGNLAVKAASNATVHIHVAELPMVRSTEHQVEFMTAPLRALDFPAQAVQDRAAYVIRTAGNPSGADVLLSEGDVVDLGAGVGLRALHCPGHTPGCVAYYWEREGMLFTGDAIQGEGFWAGGYPLYFDAPTYRRSLAAMDRVDLRLLCTGHAFIGGAPINDPVRVGAEGPALIRASMRVADSIQRAVEGVLRRSPEASKREIALQALSDLIYDIPQLRIRLTDMPLLAGPTLHAHLQAAMEGGYPT